LKLLLRKINLKESAESNVMKSLSVKDLCSKDFETISERTNFSDIVNMIVGEKRPHLSVTDAEGKFRGIISIHNIKEYLLEKDTLKFVLLAGDICDAEVFCAKPEDDCKHILEEMSKCDYDVLPILDAKGKQTGVIKRKDIDEAHSKEMEYIELTSGLAEKITMHNAENDVRFMEGYVMSEIDTPSIFVGKSIKDLGIRPKYGVEILSIQGQLKSGHSITVVPKADYVFKSDDRIIIAGKTEQINKLKNI
ncbi:MAG: CBS domain-containing protein, partial [Candidatus Kapabacteria bacterium]|nr:CBS domain-containing protein [Candidatus Kapabacteria bacterium]